MRCVRLTMDALLDVKIQLRPRRGARVALECEGQESSDGPYPSIPDNWRRLANVSSGSVGGVLPTA
jgi:hypothetical protein